MGNTSIISVAGTNGYLGAVSLSCSISPMAPSDPATCSLSPASVTLSRGAPQTSTLTVTTTSSSSAENHMKRLLWPSAASMALVLIWVPRKRRNWPAMVGLMLLFALITATSCGIGSSGGAGSNSGTSPGTYTITVIGTGTSSGSLSSVTSTVGTVTLTVK